MPEPATGERVIKLPSEDQFPFTCQVLGVDLGDPRGAMLMLMVCGPPFSVFKVPLKQEQAMRWTRMPHGTRVQLRAMFVSVPPTGAKPAPKEEERGDG